MIFIALIALCERPAQAQMSGSATIVSDYQYRGVTLSQRNFEAQLNLTYDGPSGWYLGSFASKVVRPNNDRDTQLLSYAGYSQQLLSGIRWDLGATSATFLQCSCNKYTEIFAGLGSDNFNGKIYYSPNYFGRDERTVYAEINGNYVLQEHLNAFAHLGLLHALSSSAWSTAIDNQFDTRLGISENLGDWNIQLSWGKTHKKPVKYQLYQALPAKAVLLSAGFNF